MTNEEALAVRDAAVLLLTHLQEDMNKTATKTEWIRISQLAHEAQALVQTVDSLIE